MKLSEFDFRIWDNKRQRYVKGDYEPMRELCEDDFASCCIEISKYRGEISFIADYENIDGYSFIKNGEIELWTGLKDKNGVPIFEGDIVKWRDYKGVIVFERACFFVEPIDARNEAKDLRYSMLLMLKNLDFAKNPSARLEVIGNIHKNPELLKSIKGGEASTEKEFLWQRKPAQSSAIESEIGAHKDFIRGMLDHYFKDFSEDKAPSRWGGENESDIEDLVDSLEILMRNIVRDELKRGKK